MKEIPLNGKRGEGKVAIVDDDIAIKLEDKSMSVNKAGYPVTSVKAKSMVLHRYIMGGPPKGLVTDHINQNKLDNRRENLRFVSHKKNLRNGKHNRFITAFNETKTLADWIEDERCIVDQSVLRYRLRMGENPEKAMARPSLEQKDFYIDPLIIVEYFNRGISFKKMGKILGCSPSRPILIYKRYIKELSGKYPILQDKFIGSISWKEIDSYRKMGLSYQKIADIYDCSVAHIYRTYNGRK